MNEMIYRGTHHNISFFSLLCMPHHATLYSYCRELTRAKDQIRLFPNKPQPDADQGSSKYHKLLSNPLPIKLYTHAASIHSHLPVVYTFFSIPQSQSKVNVSSAIS